MHAIALWIKQTSASQVLQDTLWAVPLLQTIHILAIAALFTSACMMNARLVGIFTRDEPMAEVLAPLARTVWIGLIFLAATGVALVVAEPERELENQLFWTKMALVTTAAVTTALGIRRTQGRRYVDLSPTARLGFCALAVLTTVLWVAIIFCGRWIAYLDVFEV